MSTKICAQCGTEQEADGQAFCSNCGAPLEGAAVPGAAVAVAGASGAMPAAAVATPAATVTLLVSGPHGSSSVPYPGHAVIAGRQDEPTRVFPEVRIDDPLVSRRHLAIWEENGRLLCQDLMSANGTLLNGAPLPPGEARPLAAGDVLTLPGSNGPTLITLQIG